MIPRSKQCECCALVSARPLDKLDEILQAAIQPNLLIRPEAHSYATCGLKDLGNPVGIDADILPARARNLNHGRHSYPLNRFGVR